MNAGLRGGSWAVSINTLIIFEFVGDKFVGGIGNGQPAAEQGVGRRPGPGRGGARSLQHHDRRHEDQDFTPDHGVVVILSDAAPPAPTVTAPWFGIRIAFASPSAVASDWPKVIHQTV